MHPARSALWLGVPVLLLMLSALLVNPFRETAVMDDWAYEQASRSLLEHGVYAWHPWVSNNSPFHVYLGAGFAQVLGVTHSAFRLSTLALALVSAASFFFLFRLCGGSAGSAGIATICLVGSPLFVRLTFSFMTNIAFLATFLAALWLYGEAWERNNWRLAVLGSLAASAAILTRVFGVALLPAIMTCWAFSGERKKRLPFLLAGIAIPVFAAVWQVRSTLYCPSWGARCAQAAQHAFLGEHRLVLVNVLARPAMALHYLALFALPLVAITVWEARRGRRNRQTSALAVAAVLYVMLAPCIAAEGKARLMPYLPWNLGGLQGCSPWVRLALTAMTGMGGALIAVVCASRYLRHPGWCAVSTSERLLGTFAVVLFGMHLVFLQMGDEYILFLLPWMLVVLGRQMESYLARSLPAAVLVSVIFWFGSSAWTRGLLAGEEAQWQAAESLVAEGFSPAQVYGPWTWVSFRRFDEYLESIQGRTLRDLNDFWGRWLPEQQRHARFWVRDTDELPPEDQGWVLIGRRPYRGFGFAERGVFIFERRNSGL